MKWLQDLFGKASSAVPLTAAQRIISNNKNVLMTLCITLVKLVDSTEPIEPPPPAAAMVAPMASISSLRAVTAAFLASSNSTTGASP